jgi:hypothetical protein
MSGYQWPDDPEQRVTMLRELAKNTPIDTSRSIPFVIGPWYYLRHLPSARAAVWALLDDPDPLVARRAIAHFEEKRDNELWTRFVELAEKAKPGPIATDLLKVLEKWAQNEAEARQVAVLVKRLATEEGPAAMKAIAVYEPASLIEIATLVAGLGGYDYDYQWRYAAELIGFFHPDRVLALLTALRGVPREVKLVTLDSAGQSIALAKVERPTLAECREAIGEPDEQPRRRKIDCRAPATRDIVAALVAGVADALGCAKEAVKSEHQSSYTPADVNNPESSWESFRVTGQRGSTSVSLAIGVGDSDLSVHVDAAPDERDRILVKLWRTFGKPPTAW